MTRDEIYAFEMLVGQMRSLHVEIGVLASKRPNDGINAFKLKLTNKLLSEANELLGDAGNPLGDLRELDADSVPTNSDVVIVLAQYLSVLEQVRSENIYQDMGRWYWLEDETDNSDDQGDDQIETGPPKKLKS